MNRYQGETKQVVLKGGSLSQTHAVLGPLGNFVCKSCNMHQNKDYGIRRFISGMKRHIRLQHKFPNLYPKVLTITAGPESAVYTMEYIPYYTAFEWLMLNPSKSDVQFFAAALWRALDRHHQVVVESIDAGIVNLYYEQEIEDKLRDCFGNIKFWRNYLIPQDGIDPFFFVRDQYKERLIRQVANVGLAECFTHGNLTLENILYAPNERRVWFIDPYDETVIDSPHADYSQLLQSAWGLYECKMQGINPSAALKFFCSLLWDRIDSVFGFQSRPFIKLLCISQFIRMLPFKAQSDEPNMLQFYRLAGQMFKEYKEVETITSGR